MLSPRMAPGKKWGGKVGFTELYSTESAFQALSVCVGGGVHVCKYVTV